jgi:hypothetical protein
LQNGTYVRRPKAEISASKKMKSLEPILPVQSQRPKPRKNQVVKNEFEKIRRKKGYDPGTHVEEILDEVAEKLNLTFEAAKKSLYYKPKK